ncbi:thiolase family protein [Lentilactobacillus hilgardii]|uniref:acetyl-CoA C-acetyltransferase n=1 Tax=Lentilactobacillus hilgardii (strain ATCC 8290 / DSM 20176 / CCUG 30140 / JCM 1155 / KCTC 3500 / NBRC 15886 / NCIMB 8040 / NRRL B-1843 / 9) TaxID=1423757 RepID=C0XHU6_LENH9|nr:thiolase family protein [Lentilactobacillus hilgardii]EEI21178.1 acetyl-CoA C-acetyltransferase [Lentilactobacillus buchneri ATCC 11577]EEI25048.1 acetyl-CoA C-acetyltransferase [Lentilactobacillus hilgardii DSM 20176 = ATCC 8290]KRK55269.1 acetyl-CoA C-acetyltransferase (acetoacetyl-CoA thiolase) [Lentilactobacillus hilgardii DSM 20176 = ATCC 8290]MCP9333657.1 thiolase family protein [Lentilactobacillus hilgardii]MCP9349296.1 thiolase family protein [Lentilactobacillus hilgardii]
MEKIVIINAKRTPIGKLNGALKDKSAVELATEVSKALIKTAKIPIEDINQVIFGNAIQAGNGQNIARQIGLNSGLSAKTTAFTINQVCGSGLKAIRQAQIELLIGEHKTILAGGTESMSNVPFLNMNQRQPTKFGSFTVYDGLERDGLTDAFSNRPMGITAENVAKIYHVSRKQQDQFALDSHLKAQDAINHHYFDEELVPIQTTNKKKSTLVSQDESVRFDTSLEKLSTLPPSFETNGTVTAGNAAGLNDGASALLLTTESHAKRLNLTPLAEIIDYAERGIDPNIMGYAPYYAIKKLLTNQEMQVTDIDLFEINEAFASQCIAVSRDLSIPEYKLNISGGAIALGHPLGDSGARIVTTLINNLNRTGQTYGIASLCMGGGMGSAMLIKKY